MHGCLQEIFLSRPILMIATLFLTTWPCCAVASVSRDTTFRPALTLQRHAIRGAASESANESANEEDHVLYSFKGGQHDGCAPTAPLVNVNGEFYGTTVDGGPYQNFPNVSGGTVFRVDSTGQEKLLHSFGSGTDGYQPSYGALVKLGDLLYGTTLYGGKYGYGAVFSINPSGSEKVVYSFAGASDGIMPEGGLIDVGGYLYGTTNSGGTSGKGTVFRLDRAGREVVIYSFKGAPDGSGPADTLIDVSGTLYGTTTGGGRFSSALGTAFSITTSGAETVLHSFGSGSDGSIPFASLVNVNGNLYGTTYAGGKQGNGTVFLLNEAGQETILHSFASSGDGADPYSSLALVNGLLFGSTIDGGSQDNGTIYSITSAGVEKVVHVFGIFPDGAAPYDTVISDGAMLYGTTNFGGANDCGTIFSLKP